VCGGGDRRGATIATGARCAWRGAGGTSLLCHQATPAKREAKHTKALGLVVNNQFDPAQTEHLDTVTEEELCVPSTNTLLTARRSIASAGPRPLAQDWDRHWEPTSKGGAHHRPCSISSVASIPSIAARLWLPGKISRVFPGTGSNSSASSLPATLIASHQPRAVPQTTVCR
jgi:hypothetical protein